MQNSIIYQFCYKEKAIKDRINYKNKLQAYSKILV